MRRTLACLFLLAAILPAAGCVERDEQITLNPDGSGKSRIDLYFDPKMVGPANNPAQRLKNILQSTQGVQAWADVAYTVENDGRAHFAGTAYFPNVSDFHFSLFNSDVHADFSKDHDGKMILAVTTPAAQRFAPRGQDASVLTEEQVKQRVRQTRQIWQQNKKFMGPSYAGLKAHVTYLLPGKVEKSNIFTATPGGVEAAVDGQKIVDGMDKLINDDAALEAAIEAGQILNTTPGQDLVDQWLFGQKGTVFAAVTGDLKPLFDYSAELGAAREAEPKMFVKLGLPGENTTSPPPLDRPLVPEPVK